MANAARVGLLVVVFVGLALGVWTFLGNRLGPDVSRIYYAEVDDAGGITPGSRILQAGVNVGSVEKIEVKDARTARLTLRLEPQAKVPEGSAVRIPSSFIGFGDTPIQLIPGPGTTELPPKSVLPGSKSSPIASMIPEAQPLLEELQGTLAETKLLVRDARKLLNDKQLYDNVNTLMANTSDTVQKFGTLAQRIDGVVASNESKFRQVLGTAAQAMGDVRKSTRMIAKIIESGEFTEETKKLLVGLGETNAKAGQLIASLDGFVNDPELRQPLAATAKNVQNITESGARMAPDLEKMAKDGTQITANTADLTKKASELADDAKEIMGQLKRIIGGGPKVGSIEFGGGIDVFRETRPGFTRTDLEGSVTFGKNKIYAGLFDAFESNKITLQAAERPNARTEFRYGIYASKPGIGVEYEIARGLSVRGDFFDVNQPRADLRARYDLGGGFYGWVGANQVFKRNSLLIGFGFRK